jgi:hypothetical protein
MYGLICLFFMPSLLHHMLHLRTICIRSLTFYYRMISDFFLPVIGGVEGHIYSLSVELMKRGHRVCYPIFVNWKQKELTFR